MSDPVQGLVALILTLDDLDDRTAVSRERFLAELERLPCPFDEEADPVHVTSSAIVVSDWGTLLHRHKRLGLWLQPGGHIDPGEHPAETVLREVKEETGLEAAHPHSGPELVHVDVHAGGRGHTHLDLRYLVRAPAAQPAPPPGESQDVRWFSWEEAISLADPGLVAPLRALAARFATTRHCGSSSDSGSRPK